MKKLRNLIILGIVVLFTSTAAWAGNCFYCLQHLEGDAGFCDACRLKQSARLGSSRSNEAELLDRVEMSRKNYKAALSDVSQFYLDVGDRLRLKNANTELEALGNVPQLLHTEDADSSDTQGYASGASGMKNIEEANILFFDANSYSNVLPGFNKKESLNLAAKRYEMLIEKHPESDKASDAAFFLAEIYCEPFFEAFEKAADLYVRCYETNPSTNKPALYKAGMTYDFKINDLRNAIKYYKLAIEKSPEKKHKKRARRRLDEWDIE